MGSKKSMNISDHTDLLKNVSDLEIFGTVDCWKLISKASSEEQQWMRSTKALEIRNYGCLVQVSTQIGDAIAESVTFVPNISITEIENSRGEITERILVKSDCE